MGQGFDHVLEGKFAASSEGNMKRMWCATENRVIGALTWLSSDCVKGKWLPTVENVLLHVSSRPELLIPPIHYSHVRNLPPRSKVS